MSEHDVLSRATHGREITAQYIHHGSGLVYVRYLTISHRDCSRENLFHFLCDETNNTRTPSSYLVQILVVLRFQLSYLV